jgi:GT2 family glycosyltransferase
MEQRPRRDRVAAGDRPPQPPAAAKRRTERQRPEVDGKFLAIGDERLFVRGVTYGTFQPAPDGTQYPPPAMVQRDFAAMSALGANTVRVYTVPPTWLLDAAAAQGLRVLVGVPWEQHVTFLDDRRRVGGIVDAVRRGAQSCAGHPAVLAIVVGNEIPASIVRWHSRGRVERFLSRLSMAVKEVDDGALVTYANYPSTEYLELPFLDFVSFNVFLEEPNAFEDYISRLQIVAGERPLVLSEIGIDSRAHGRIAQADLVSGQVGAAFRGGAAGAVVFSWTDEWHRGGDAVVDWEFGLVDRSRRSKPALWAVRKAFASAPAWPRPTPRVSVIVCTYNGARTLADCLDGIAQLDYPDVEAVVVDDGSTDETSVIATRDGVKLIRTANNGLSAARNVGLAAATGEIVAYLDDDARPDVHWLRFIVQALLTSKHAGVGGPNLAPPAPPVATAVAGAPGGPSHVLLTDDEAEHIPGCNMAFWRDALLEIGGFDERFRVAGDDVDACWRLQATGRSLGFCAAAAVWHQPRRTIRAFLGQQRGYGRAEALLEEKWPEKYGVRGHIAWQGRIYNRPASWIRRRHVYHGTWGSAGFQPLQEGEGSRLRTIVLAPEWWGLILLLALASSYELLIAPLAPQPPLLPIPVTTAGFLALMTALGAGVASVVRHQQQTARVKALTCLLTAAQPLARLAGRLELMPSSWRRLAGGTHALPIPGTVEYWSEEWEQVERRLERVEEELRRTSLAVARGGPYDRWDLEVACSSGMARLRTVVEEHGSGRQMFRFRVWPWLTRGRAVVVGGLVGLIALSWSEGLAVIAPLVALAGVVVGHAALELAAARGAMDTALRLTEAREESSATAAIAPEPIKPGSVLGVDGVLGVDVALAVADRGGGAIP